MMTRRPELTDRSSAPRAKALGLVVGDRAATLTAAIVLTAYYLWSMHRNMSMYDSPELAMVAEQLGLGHPIGQPLHTIIGHLVSRLTPDPLLGLNALSAIAGAWTIAPVASLVESWGVRGGGKEATRAGIVGITVCALLPALWEPATRIETYPLANFCALWAAARLASVEADSLDWRGHASAGLMLGLSASANPYCALGTAVAMSPWLVLPLPRSFARLRQWLSLGTFGLVGLLPYAYVPWVARREDVVVWGRPVGNEALWRFFSGADYARARAITGDVFVDNVQQFLAWAWSYGLTPLWVLGLVGLLAYGDRVAGRFAALAPTIAMLFFVGLIVSNAVFAPDVLDYLGYLSVPSWMAIAGVGVLVCGAVPLHRYAAAAGALAICALVATSPPQPWARTRRLDRVTMELALRALESTPTDAIVIVESDHWVAPMWYMQEQRGVRPDVVVIAYGLTGSSWYWDLVKSRHPDLKEIDLRGGDRVDRLRSWLAANPERALMLERPSLGHRIGVASCAEPWLWRAGAGCEASEAGALVEFVAEERSRLGDGSPGTPGLLSALAHDRAVGLLGLGRPRQAVEALVASSSSSKLRSLDLAELPSSDAGPTRIALPAARSVALGDEYYNLELALRIAEAYGASELVSALAPRNR